MIGLKLDGRYVGCEPFAPWKAYRDRVNLAGWEEVRLTSVGTLWRVDFVTANRTFSDTPFGPDSRPFGTFGVWEQFTRDGDKLIGFSNRYTLVGGPVSSLALMPRVQGLDFVNDQGQRRVLKGVSQFFAFRKWLDGRIQLDSLVQESQTLGFDTWRVWFMGSQRQNTIADINPGDSGVFAQIRPFVDYVNSRGILVNGNAFVDAQDVMPDFSVRSNHWQHLGSALQGSGILLSYGNQRDKNGTPYDAIANPGVMWSRGSWTADPDPFMPMPEGASFTEFHPRRDLPVALLDTVASPVTLYERDQIGTPLIISEPPKFGTNGSGDRYDARMAQRFAQHYSAEVAGVVFHNYFSQRSLPMDDPTFRIAQAWQSRIIA